MNKNKILLKKTQYIEYAEITPPSSKSESNRVLIIDALMKKNHAELCNLSSARDTTTMRKLLKSIQNLDMLDVLDAGTTMRFLTAFVAVGEEPKTLTGTTRLKERPIGILTESLKKLGAKIVYINKNGYPPIIVHPIKNQLSQEISIKSDVSSQFISALLMIAPTLPQGLILHLIGNKISSLPYILMTLEIMKKYGIKHTWAKQVIHILHQSYAWKNPQIPYVVEGDWSAASYWYSMVALSNNLTVKLLGMHSNSLQGDVVIIDIMEDLGVITDILPQENAIILRKTKAKSKLNYDFSNCPDLAQSIIVTCACLNIRGSFSGLESLRIKETDRIAALQHELKKFKVDLKQESANIFSLNGDFKLKENQLIRIQVYKDHRMAMAFAPLSIKFPLIIEHPEVVNKSYPHFWKDLTIVGIQHNEAT